MKNNLIHVLLATCTLATAHAASNDRRTLLDLQWGNGTHSLTYTGQANLKTGLRELGHAEKKWGSHIGAIATHYLSRQWGVESGMKLSLYRTSSTLNGEADDKMRDHTNGLDYTRTTTYMGWKEKQTELLLCIPFGPSFHAPIGQKLNLYATCGIEVQLPIASKYSVEAGRAKATGYYPSYNVTFEDMPEHNFGTNEERASGRINTKIGLAGYADAGLHFGIGNLVMNAGLYFSYGLTNMAKEKTAPAFNQNTEYNGMLNSNLVSEVRSMAAGAKVGITLPLGKKK